MASLDIVDGIVNRLLPLIENEVNLHLNSKEEAQLLASNLLNIKQVLDDAENKQLTDPSIKQWLEELQQLAYDAEDALDEWEIMQKQNDGCDPEAEDEEIPPPDVSSDATFWDKVCPFIHSLCSCFNKVVEHRKIALDVQGLNKMVEGMYDKAEKVLQLKRLVGGSSGPERVERERKLEDSVVVESEVRGRDSDKEALKSMLFSDEGDVSSAKESAKPIVAIVGVGGLGKTTLAKLVYNDSDVKQEFPLRIWVCVSDPFDEIRVAREILECIEGFAPDVSAKESLMRRIKDKIGESGKFLLVLDDVWTDDPKVWQPLKDYLSYGSEGSKVMITTRNRRIAERIKATHIRDLQSLTNEETWSIISHLALSDRSPSEQGLLEGVGREIAKKCNGLPLAAQFLGSLLQSRRTVLDWRLVLHSELWEMKNVEDDVFRFFFMSYKELEPAVKRCFSYCAIFPKDHRINVEELIRMWMAQGLIPPSARGGEMELQGMDYFMELAHRGFFQDFIKDADFRERVVYCNMHDIVHDFAQFLSKPDCIVLKRILGDGDTGMNTNTRHLWIEDPEIEAASRCNAAKLRSLVCGEAADVALSLLPHLKCVRVLSLAACGLESIPDEIGDLLLLRYLDLSGNNMDKLPESICNLFNLQTLDITNCSNLKALPHKFFKLINLRHLLLDQTSFEYPNGFSRLVNLRTLSQFRTAKGYCHLGYLKDMNKIGGKIVILLFGLDEEADVEEATNAALSAKESLRTLLLSYYNDDVIPDVVEALQPPSSLQHLMCHGGIYPSWISSLTYLRKLDLSGTSSYDPQAEEESYFKFPPLWNLGFLEELTLSQIFRLKYLGREFLGLYDVPGGEEVFVAFGSLQKLSFGRCINWREWEDISEEEGEGAAAGRIRIMPRLRELIIYSCGGLEALPHRMLFHVASGSLQHLYLKWDNFKLMNLYQRDGPNWDRISHIGRVST